MFPGPGDPPCSSPTLAPSPFALRPVQPTSVAELLPTWDLTPWAPHHLCTSSTGHHLQTRGCEQLTSKRMDTGMQRLSHVIPRFSESQRNCLASRTEAQRLCPAFRTKTQRLCLAFRTTSMLAQPGSLLPQSDAVAKRGWKEHGITMLRIRASSWYNHFGKQFGSIY